MKNLQTSRRQLLAALGAGAALLPLLAPRRGFSATPLFPKRLLIVTLPNGYHSDDYIPTGTATQLSDLQLSDSLSPLAPWKDQLAMLAPMDCPNINAAEDYHRSYAMNMSGGPSVDKQLGPESVWSPTLPTLDQVIGGKLAAQNLGLLRTLPLRLPFGDVFGVDSKREALRSFWIGENQPVTPEVNPYNVISSYFAGKAANDPMMESVRAEKRSMLDFLGRDLERFSKSLGTADQLNVAGHLQAIRDIESILGQTPAAQPLVPDSITSTAGMPLDFNSLMNYPALVKIQFDLATAALRADLTRVVTVQLGSAWGDAHTFPWLPGTGENTWHSMGHDDGPEKRVLDKWLMGQFSELLARLAAVPEVGPNSKTMLDNTVVLWATTMLTGTHTPQLPWMLAGSCGGAIKTGQYLRGSEGIPVNRLLIDLCQAMEVPVTSFGDPTITGSVPGLLA